MSHAASGRGSAEIVHVEPKPEHLTPQDRANLCLFFNAMVALAASEDRNLTLRQIAVLVTAGEGTYSARDIFRLLGIPKPAIVRACDQLEARGLLRRSATKEDGRLAVLRQTPAGQRLLKALVASRP